MAKEESAMSSNNSYSESHLERVGINVKRQLLASNVLTTKSLQLGIQDADVIELLDRFINEWIENCKKHSIEYKSLTGWILLDTVKRRFLDI
jgi:hypothetical protein